MIPESMIPVRRLVVAVVALLAIGLALSFVARFDPIADRDQTLTESLHERALDDDTVAAVALDVTSIGDPITLTVFVVVVAVWLAFRRHRRTALWLVLVTLLASIVGRSTKLLVGRSRPDLDTALLEPTSQSFPSGHAFNTTVVLGAVAVALVISATSRRALAVPVAAIVAASVALAVGLSRPVLGVHFVADVVAGWLLGVVWLVLVRPRRDAEVRPEPEPTSV